MNSLSQLDKDYILAIAYVSSMNTEQNISIEEFKRQVDDSYRKLHPQNLDSDFSEIGTFKR